MALLFSNTGEDAITRGCDLNNQLNPEVYNIVDFYEVLRCEEWINAHSFSKVALQFPDHFLKDAAEVAIMLEKCTQAKIYVLGDTSYGGCCVDEVAAEHVTADAIIHFGHACLSPTNRLPVLYVFGKFPLDVEHVEEEFKKLFPDRVTDVIVFCDVSYIHVLEKLKASLEVEYKNLVFAKHNLQQEKSPTNDEKESYIFITKLGRTFPVQKDKLLSEYSVFYIGLEQQTIMNLMLSFNGCKFFSYHPPTKSARQETVDVNKYIRKRYYCIERVRDAKIIGILVGTLGVSNYLTIINHLRTLARCSGKKPYTLVVGKLNPAKLANFSEVDVFVYVSCPESSIVDSHEFYQPIVTPFEMEVACNQARVWTGNYITDYNELLSEGCAHVPLDPAQSESADVSLVTGRIRSLGVKSKDKTSEYGNEVSLRDKMTVANIHENAAGEYLTNRSWQGLERHLGETPASKVTQGKLGIAIGYENEGNNIT